MSTPAAQIARQDSEHLAREQANLHWLRASFADVKRRRLEVCVQASLSCHRAHAWSPPGRVRLARWPVIPVARGRGAPTLLSDLLTWREGATRCRQLDGTPWPLPQETTPREQFVQVTAAEIRKAHFLRQVTIQSFDRGALMRMRQVEPRRFRHPARKPMDDRQVLNANQPFELFAHIVFGTLLSFSFFGSGARRGEPILAIRGVRDTSGDTPSAWSTGR